MYNCFPRQSDRPLQLLAQMHPLPFFDPRSELWYLPSSRLSLSSWPARYRGTHPRRQYHCTVLHVVLVVAHIFLFVVYSRHFEHKISVDINTFSTTWLPLLVTTALQTLGTVGSVCPNLTI